MHSLPEMGARPIVGFLACIIFIQLGIYYRTSFHIPGIGGSDSSDSSNEAFMSGGSFGDPVRNRHPTVPLSLKELDILDKLSDTIVQVEALRVFGKDIPHNIHGATIKGQTRERAQQIRDQIQCWTQNGSWVRIDGHALTKPPGIPHLGDSRFSRCDGRFMESLDQEAQAHEGEEGHVHYLGELDAKNDRWVVREATKYKWVPNETICGQLPLSKVRAAPSTVYEPFEAAKFCRVLRQRNLMIVGDVTQYQLHDVLLSAVQKPFVCHGELGCLHRSPHELCATSNLKFSRNDVISVPWAIDPEKEEFPSASTVEQPWATDELLQEYNIVLLNKGLVWRPDEEFLNELVFTIKYLWRYYPKTMFIYRATHPVSNNCTALKEAGEDEAMAGKDGRSTVPGTMLQTPLDQSPERTKDNEDPKMVFRPTLADIQRQNKMAKHIVEAAGGIFLDTEKMFALRPDGRMGDGDCSRFCAPGPLDAYTDLLYNTLKILEA
ncbi:hypothetical protein EMPS_07567 [Entomortierella parvispora]|uniref:Uncharacterized protein n=1 Tax=Entomortierella parvispora TaxID=205924 RepID=A0A9P3HEJ2_9FUNG|nr:hypothetical protein EMPS_07567 [Entomortierella parvispora]